jgi:hypothetical protein
MRENFTAIQGVCAWPNLVPLPSGELLAFIFNQPCHGMWEGDVDCWASPDGGRTWSFRGRPAQHEPGANRMNCSAGLDAAGDPIVLCSGWDHRGAVGVPVPHTPPAEPIRTVVCRSSDAGRTWRVTGAFPDAPAGYSAHGPFGHILVGDDGTLRAAIYARANDRKTRAVWMFRSQDGNTWGEKAMINPLGNETDLLHLGGGRWIASSRQDLVVNLFRSEDDGRTWTFGTPLTLPRQVTSHLMRLADGRILLSHGNRCSNNFGVDVRVSEDQGVTWGPPARIADTPHSDCGYPSTVQRPDGTLVTAYYTRLGAGYHYEMRVAFWDVSELR